MFGRATIRLGIGPHSSLCVFSMFNNSESFPILIANKNFPCHFSFTCLLLPSICGTENSSQQTSLQCLSTINMIFSDEDKILIKSLYLKGYTAERLTKECPEKSGTKHGAVACCPGALSCGCPARAPGSATVLSLIHI